MVSYPVGDLACMLYHRKLNNYMTHTNISNFEAEKPRQTYAAIDSMISKYRQIVNEHTYNGQSLIMEGTDNARLHLAQQIVAELENVKALFIAGR